jgi:hypothetical protein
VPVKVKQTNDNFLSDTTKVNNRKGAVNDMRMNDTEMAMRRNHKAGSIPEISVQSKSRP